MCRIVHKKVLLFIVVLAIEAESRVVNLVTLQCFPCGTPQPRSVRVDREIPQLWGLRFAPIWTVLHRCDSGSGCCKEINTSCNASHWEDLTVKVFVTTDLEDGKEKKEFQLFKVQNHTKCYCESTLQDHK